MLLTTNKQTIPASPPVISGVKHDTQLLAVFLHVCGDHEIQDRCGWLKPAVWLSGLLIGCFVLDDSQAQTQRLVTEECRACDHVREAARINRFRLQYVMILFHR